MAYRLRRDADAPRGPADHRDRLVQVLSGSRVEVGEGHCAGEARRDGSRPRRLASSVWQHPWFRVERLAWLILDRRRDAAADGVSIFHVAGTEYQFSIPKRLIHRLPPQRSVDTLRRDARHGLRHDHDDELLFRIDPESRARGAAPVVLSSRARDAGDAVSLANREAEPESVAGAAAPVATKRAIRAILKAADLCATEPDRVARTLVDRQFTPRYDYAVQMLRELPYGKWREYDPEDTIRFYALRLHEAGMLKSNPQKLIARATDWRFLNELKKEFKA